MILQRVRMPTPSECFAPGLRTVTSVIALLVEQPAQLEVDLPRREVVGVELGRRAVDLGDLRDGGVGLGEAARVVADRVLA